MTSLGFKYLVVLLVVLTGSDSKSESDSNTDGEMTTSYPHEDADKLAYDKSEETYKEWGKYWQVVKAEKSAGILDVTQGQG